MAVVETRLRTADVEKVLNVLSERTLKADCAHKRGNSDLTINFV